MVYYFRGPLGCAALRKRLIDTIYFVPGTYLMLTAQLWSVNVSSQDYNLSKLNKLIVLILTTGLHTFRFTGNLSAVLQYICCPRAVVDLSFR